MSRVSLTFDAERSVDKHECRNCGAEYSLVSGYLHRNGTAHAVFFAACHTHDAMREVWIDVIIEAADGSADGRATFGCRVGPVEGQQGPAASLVTAAEPYGNDPEWGTKLSREEALADPRLPEFWNAVDFILVNDPTIRPHVYGID
jgi:hypothetical protein